MLTNFIESIIAITNQYPQKPAIIFHEKIMTYLELHQRSNELAQHLMSSRVGSEEIIPLIMEREPNTIIAMLGVLKAGGAFLPISPITPCSRIRFILEDTQAKCIISNTNVDEIIPPKIHIIKPDSIPSSSCGVTSITNPNHLAYVMYTSGSTGNPKGVLIEHGSMMNLFSCLISQLNITQEDQFLALTDYTFDISLIELLMPLLCGATIVLTEQGTVADGVKIKFYLEKYSISLMQATPLSWEILLKQGWNNDGCMKILVGGEQFKTQLAKLLDYKKGNVWNMYGPTETSMWSMAYRLQETLITESVPLGSPLKNTTIKILNEELDEVETGTQGELYIGGHGLARGYLNNLELSANRFIIHPKTHMRLYKTGDIAVIQDNQDMCYLGRTDDQLKFGGIRIEAGEIEHVIEQEPFVEKAVVKLHETEGYYKSLAAYIEVNEELIFSNGIHTTNIDVINFLKNIYDETYLHADEYEHGTINNCGWQSSFTGELFSVEELDESYQWIRNIINKSTLTHVLEVGCGTGSLLLEYLDKAQECTVVEISSKAIEYVRSRLNKKQQQKVNFKNESIVNIHDHQKYSCIIVNSVIQYLPSIHSLIQALTQLVTATQSNGTIIIGDVRSLELMDVYLLEKIRKNAADAEEINFNLSSFYYKSRDTEIVLSPYFFYALQHSIKEISHVDISVKHGNYANELNYFRFDVVLHINKPVLYTPPISIHFSPELTCPSLVELINAHPNESLVVHQIPNVPIQKLIQLIDKDLPNHLALPAPGRALLFNEELSEQIHALINIQSKTHEVFIHYDGLNPINSLEIHLHPKAKKHLLRCIDSKEYRNYRTYCREPFNPWLQQFCFDHIKLKVSQHVVSWVNPSVYVWIEKWPLSINGKLDKKKLQLPPNCTQNPEDASILEQLQAMWRNITGDNALVNKEFWVHGVSSLCMYFFLATINETFLVNINYHEFRDYNTLDKLADYIKQLLDIT